MFRNIAAALLGYVVWTVIFLGGGATLRSVFAAAHDDAGMTRAPGILLLYLGVSILASLAAGFTTGRISTPPRVRWVWVLVLLLLGTGIPVQISAWDSLPVWYHLIFLGLLAPVTLWGGFVADTRYPSS